MQLKRQSLKHKSIVFLDFDGVLTSMHEEPGSYFNFGHEYGVSPSCYTRLMKICKRSGAEIILSSNWRRFEDDGVWSCFADGSVHSFKNPLPKLKKMLGPLCIGELPKDRHITKSQALVLWFEQFYDPSLKFVILDDDKTEGFQHESAYRIKDHFILTDYEHGLTDDDVLRALEVLKL